MPIRGQEIRVSIGADGSKLELTLCTFEHERNRYTAFFTDNGNGRPATISPGLHPNFTQDSPCLKALIIQLSKWGLELLLPGSVIHAKLRGEEIHWEPKSGAHRTPGKRLISQA